MNYRVAIGKVEGAGVGVILGQHVDKIGADRIKGHLDRKAGVIDAVGMFINEPP